MKFVLIAFLVKDLVVSPPWATSAVAEFNTMEACQHAASRLQTLADKRNVRLDWACLEKGTEPPK